MTGRVFTDPSVAAYHAPQHPEAPWRVTRTIKHLESVGFCPERPDVRASAADVLTIHTDEHWNSVESGLFFDPDTPAHDGIAPIVLTSLSGALAAAESASRGVPAFSLMRPPGHHAGRERISGFCYVNNVAVACERLARAGKRISILDIDVHHGDGTQSIVLGRPGWQFVSIHQSPLFPGTGLESTGNCRNHPLPEGTNEREYLATLKKALAQVYAFRPDILAVSAGFDTYKACPIAGFRLEIDSYRKIGEAIRELGVPRFAVLEGGYADALPQCIEAFLKGFFPA